MDKNPLSAIFGPTKGDYIHVGNKEYKVDSCHVSVSREAQMPDYIISAKHGDGKEMRLRVPIEDMTNNGWAWHVGKFPYDLKFKEIAGKFHIADPIYQNTVDINAGNESTAVAKAQAFFQSDSLHFTVHKIYEVRIKPSASKMVALMNRAIKMVPHGIGPLACSSIHPSHDLKSKMLPQDNASMRFLQQTLEQVFIDYNGDQSWWCIGEGTAYSTQDFEILDCSPLIDGRVQI